MSTWPQSVERWRQLVNWECKDIPPDLVLSIIAHESGGKAGEPSHIEEGEPQQIPKTDGGTELVTRSYGLMQIGPSTVKSWNDSHTGNDIVYVEDLRGSSERAARLQIRVGSWMYAAQVAQLHDTYPANFPSKGAANASPDQLKLALVAYATGGNWKATSTEARGLRPKLEQLKAAGEPLTFDALKKNFPSWVPRALAGVDRRWAAYQSATQADPITTALTKPWDVSIDVPVKTKKEDQWWKWPAIAIGALIALQQWSKGYQTRTPQEEEEREHYFDWREGREVDLIFSERFEAGDVDPSIVAEYEQWKQAEDFEEEEEEEEEEE